MRVLVEVSVSCRCPNAGEKRGGGQPFTPSTNPGCDGHVSIQFFMKNMYWNAPRITLNTDNSINTNEIADIHFKISNNVHCVNV